MYHENNKLYVHVLVLISVVSIVSKKFSGSPI